MTEPKKITRQAYEVALLQSLIELGGSVKPGVELYQCIAEKMGFAGQDMKYDLIHARENGSTRCNGYGTRWFKGAI